MATNGHGHAPDEERISWASLWEPKPEPRADVVPLSPDVFLNMDGWLRAAIEGEMANVTNAEIGTRNHALNTAAYNLGQIIGAGSAERATVEQALRQAAFDAGLAEREVDATLRSGLTAGIANPRVIKPLVSSTVTEVSADVILRGLPAATDEPLTTEEIEARRTSWWGDDLVAEASRSVNAPEPTHLVRDDGKALLYSGKINALIGEAESGKSWVALLAAAQAIRNGEQVLLLDFEDSAGSVLGRLRALGFEDSDLVDRVRYVRPDEGLGFAQVADLQELINTGYFAVIIVDGVNAAMTTLGYDLNSNTDATLFTTKLLRPLALTGACVITVDHVPKNPETRGKGGIGAQAKRAMIDGTALLVEVVEPFGKGQSGLLRLIVDKDRNGIVRGLSANGKNPGMVRFTSIMDTVGIVVEAPMATAQQDKPWRPTGLMAKISKLVEEFGEPSQNTIRQATVGNDHQIRQAIDILVQEGWMTRRPGPRNSILYRSVRPFTDGSEPDLGHLGQPVPDLGQELAQRPWPPPPLPTGGGQGQRSSGPAENQTTSANVLNCKRCDTEIDEQTWDAHDGHCRDCAWAADQ